MQANYQTPKCCDKASVTNMDHNKAVPGKKGFYDVTPTINRCCTKCGQHWYGPVGKVKEYTRVQWDNWINATTFA